jgi:hypothetical protein
MHGDRRRSVSQHFALPHQQKEDGSLMSTVVKRADAEINGAPFNGNRSNVPPSCIIDPERGFHPIPRRRLGVLLTAPASAGNDGRHLIRD